MAALLEDTMDSDFEYRRMTIKEVVEKIEEVSENYINPTAHPNIR